MVSRCTVDIQLCCRSLQCFVQLITFATEVSVLPGVCLSCLSVCFSVKNLVEKPLIASSWIFFIRHVSLDKEVMECWKSSAIGSGSRNFWRILQHCHTEHIFPQFGSYICKNWSNLRGNFVIDVFFDKEVFVKFWKSSGFSSDSHSWSGSDSPWPRSALSEYSCFCSC